MHWNPTNPSLLAAGCVNGAVCYFDMSDANAAMRKKKKRATAGGGEEGDGSSGGGAGAGSSDSKDGGSEEGGEGGSAGGAEKALRVKAKAVASVEGSHAHGVAFIRWLPMSHHISHRHVFAEEKEEAHACQFLSVAADGVVACWDIRYKEKDKRGRRHDEGAAVPLPLNSTLVPGAANANILAPPQEIPWVPHYKVAIKLGAGAVPITKVVLNDRKPSDPLVCGTDEGHIVAVDWAPAGEGTGTDAWTGSGSGSGGDDDSGGGGGGPGQRLLWSSPDANGRAVHIQRSPFLADTYLVVYDFHFVLWRAGAAAPLYASPAATTPYTAGKWSPTRPAVLFLARADGVVAVWDLLDSSLKPSTTFSLVSIPVTSLEFRVYAGASAAAATGKQLLAAGDSKGSLHILDVPGPLRRGGGNEEALLKGFLDREAVRAGYVAGRVAVREAEKAKKDAAATAAAAAKEAAAQKLDAELKGELSTAALDAAETACSAGCCAHTIGRTNLHNSTHLPLPLPLSLSSFLQPRPRFWRSRTRPATRRTAWMSLKRTVRAWLLRRRRRRTRSLPAASCESWGSGKRTSRRWSRHKPRAGPRRRASTRRASWVTLPLVLLLLRQPQPRA